MGEAPSPAAKATSGRSCSGLCGCGDCSRFRKQQAAKLRALEEQCNAERKRHEASAQKSNTKVQQLQSENAALPTQLADAEKREELLKQAANDALTRLAEQKAGVDAAASRDAEAAASSRTLSCSWRSRRSSKRSRTWRTRARRC